MRRSAREGGEVRAKAAKGARAGRMENLTAGRFAHSDQYSAEDHPILLLIWEVTTSAQYFLSNVMHK